jgi:hypothetical protein
VIEPYVLDAFWRFVADWRGRQSADSDALDTAERAVRDAEAELDAALDTRLADALGGAGAERYVTAVETRRAALDEARDAFAAAERGATAALAEVNLRELWPDMPLHDQRQLLRLAFGAVFVRRGTDVAERTWICEVAPELPVRGRRWIAQPFHFPPATEALGEDGD